MERQTPKIFFVSFKKSLKNKNYKIIQALDGDHARNLGAMLLNTEVKNLKAKMYK